MFILHANNIPLEHFPSIEGVYEVFQQKLGHYPDAKTRMLLRNGKTILLAGDVYHVEREESVAVHNHRIAA